MKATKEQWARLGKGERSTLVFLERAAAEPTKRNSRLPDDCAECPSCGEPVLGGGLCDVCNGEYEHLIRKLRDEQI